MGFGAVSFTLIQLKPSDEVIPIVLFSSGGDCHRVHTFCVFSLACSLLCSTILWPSFSSGYESLREFTGLSSTSVKSHISYRTFGYGKNLGKYLGYAENRTLANTTLHISYEVMT